MISYLQRFFKVSWRNIPFQIIPIIAIFYVFIFIPQLKSLAIIYSLMFLLAEFVMKGEQITRTPLKKGLLLFLGFFFVTIFILSTIPGLKPINSLGLDLTFISVLAYFTIVAYSEEVVFREILPKVFQSKIIPLILYVFFHLAIFKGFYELAGSGLIIALIFTAVFGFIAQYIRDHTKSNAGNIGFHLGYDLFANGYLTMAMIPLGIGGVV